MQKSILFVGLDEAKDSIAVAVAEEGRDGEVREYGMIPNTPESLRKLVRKLGRTRRLSVVYEAGPCGYTTYRLLRSLGVECFVVAPSKVPRRPGDRIKNDRRDASGLARSHRAGELTTVWVPEQADEAMRDLTRTREYAKYAQTRARQRLGAFLLSHGRRYPGRTHWTGMHLRWIQSQRMEHPAQQICLEESLKAVEETTARVARLDEQIQAQLATWSMAPVVRGLMTHRGVSQLIASTVVAEMGDLRRFTRAREVMGFVGLVPSLMQTGQKSYRGAITKTGNTHVRRCLVEAAWAYRHPARRSVELRKREEGQPEAVRELAWKAQVRMCGRYRRMTARGKEHNKVIVATARELIGFLWATARLVEPNKPTDTKKN